MAVVHQNIEASFQYPCTTVAMFSHTLCCACVYNCPPVYMRLLESASLIIRPASTVERVLSRWLLICPLSGPSKPVCDVKE